MSRRRTGVLSAPRRIPGAVSDIAFLNGAPPSNSWMFQFQVIGCGTRTNHCEFAASLRDFGHLGWLFLNMLHSLSSFLQPANKATTSKVRRALLQPFRGWSAVFRRFHHLADGGRETRKRIIGKLVMLCRKSPGVLSTLCC